LDAWRWRRTGAALAGAISFVALGASVVYGLDVSLQFYALALIAPAILLVTVVIAPASRRLDAMLPEGWRQETMPVARAAVPVATFVAVVAALTIDARWSMTPAFALAVAFYG